MKFWRALTRPVRWAALLAGALPVLAFPAPNLEILAWLGLVPGLLLMRAAPSGREAAVRGCWFGCGYLLFALYWLAPNLGPGLLLIAIVLGLLWSCVGVATWRLLRAPVTVWRALAAVAVVPSCWLVTEWIRSWQALGGPWAVFGVSQWQHPAVLALAAVGGVWLITFALVAANTGLVIALAARRIPVRLVGVAAAAIAIAAGPIAFAVTAPSPVTRQVTIALVQAGLTNGTAGQRLAVNEQLTGTQASRADLIVWGESSVGFDLDAEPARLAQLKQLSRQVGAQILVSQDAITPAGGHDKVALLIDKNGVAGRYTKTRLVPFGEYIPFRGQLGWLTSISRAAASNMVPGSGAHVLHATLRDGSALNVGVLICFESAFPDMSRFDADHGAQVIIYQTSDSTFQHSWALQQHASLSAIRAAETGRPVVQAALTGDSAAFDARGRLIGFEDAGQRGTLMVRLSLPPASARTPFDRLKDYVPWTATGIAVLAGAVALAGIARRRTGRAAPPGGPGSQAPAASGTAAAGTAPDGTTPAGTAAAGTAADGNAVDGTAGAGTARDGQRQEPAGHPGAPPAGPG
ncbi:MAG TPA: apolipoprotein N-acyltransferase [Streptosporangiaceae bacterium]